MISDYFPLHNETETRGRLGPDPERRRCGEGPGAGGRETALGSGEGPERAGRENRGDGGDASGPWGE